MKKFLFFILTIIFSSLSLIAQTSLTIDLKNKGVNISPTHNGIFFEDINHATDGGIYAELIRNRSFEDAATPESWSIFGQSGASLSYSLVTTGLLNSAQTKALQMTFSNTSTTARAGVSNSGFWGINVVKKRTYTVSFFAKCAPEFNGSLMVSLESANSDIYAIDTIKGLTTGWKKYTCTLTASGSNSSGRFVISSISNGTVYLDVVSVFPPTYKNRPNGLRPELAKLLEDMHPKFFRFPGGCFVEGDYLSNRFQWKKSIGPIEERPGHSNLWGYRTSDGMGYLEYLQLCEDIGANPLYVINVGLSHKDYQDVNSLDGYIQDALDALEYANGDVNTTYGAMRAAAGHPAPFNIKYVEIGNENRGGNNYDTRYVKFRTALKQKYPDIEFIGNVDTWADEMPVWTSSGYADYYDQHYYRPSSWFAAQYHKYDSYSRTGTKIYAGEYAATSECGLGNFAAAVGEAVYMCGMEINSDVVRMNSYAPIFVNVNDRKWSPDMIDFDASRVYCTPSYYVQKLFATNIGTVNINVQDSDNSMSQGITGAVGLGSWATQVKYDDLLVKKPDGTALITDNFTDATAWTPGSGSWAVDNGSYAQTSTSTDCRSITKNVSDSVYTYSVKALKTGGNEGFLIIFGCKDSKNFYWWNIGGWSNSKHAIEQCVNGTKTVVSQVAGSIQSNVWYDVRIEVSASIVKCYLNNQLVQSFCLPLSNKLYSSATFDEAQNELYVKVVNPGLADVTSTLNFRNLATSSLSGELTVLTSNSATDENTLTIPNKVIPVTTLLNSPTSKINYTFKANSVNVIKINTSGTNEVRTTPINSFSISPNPVGTQFVVHSGTDGQFDIELKSMNGTLVMLRKVCNGSVVDISSLNAGTYVVTTGSAKKCHNLKIIVKK